MRCALLVGTALALWPASAQASNDCWIAGKFTGRSAMSFQMFQFIDDKLQDGTLICFTEKGGGVTNSDLQFVRFGESTLIGFGHNDKGLETVNVYQIDRGRGKVFVSQTRIGTATVTGLLPDYVAAFVGDARREPR